MTTFNARYRIESTRLTGYDYAAAGYYFVTICTRQRHHFFGEVVDGDMQLSPIGEIVADEWLQTAQLRPYVTLDAWIVMPNHIHGIIIIHEPILNANSADTTADVTADVETARWAVSPHREETPHRGVSTTNANAATTPMTHNANAATTPTGGNTDIDANSDTTADTIQTARRAQTPHRGRTPHRGVSTGGSPSTDAIRPSVLRPRSLGAIVGQFKSSATKRIWAAGWRDFGWQTRFYDHIIRDQRSLDRIRRYIADNPRRWHLDRENDEQLYM